VKIIYFDNKVFFKIFPKIFLLLENNALETPRITVGFSLTSRLGNALALSLQSRGLKIKNLLKQAWQIFFVFISGCARSLHRGGKGSEVELFWGGFV